ncbi:MAG: serine/threonine protein kinase [Planctomycetes bacterium]|nr:serine/threonine protein kinase [Planctomycetota bacterium]
MDLEEGARWVMDASRWARLKEVHSAALDVEVAKRFEYIDAVCGGDTDLRAEVAALLRVESDTALETPAWRVATVPEEGTEPALLTPGSVLGQYEIVRLIGRGGMGEVYEATQKSPSRRVAIKVVGSWSYSARAARRLENEAAMLARLDHPNIAGVIELAFAEIPGAGKRAYVVMEFVDGVPLTEAARGARVDAKLGLFQQVCDAVEHAHQRGVLHRDLKPTNILVDASSRVRVVDFGIAGEVLESGSGGVASLQTRITAPDAIVPGTLAYMSPEQASGHSKAVDTRSDVFALGVVLFELLAGELPRDPRAMSLVGLLRSITEDEPPRLSAREPSFRGDLDLIVRAAMAREPAFRYQSASALRTDIERFRTQQPLAIRPASLRYSLAKLIRRNRVTSAAIGLGVIALCAGVMVGAIQYRKAVRAEALARERLSDLRRSSTELITDLYDKLWDMDGVTTARKYLAGEALRRLEKLLAIDSDDPALLWDLSTACMKLAAPVGAFGSPNSGDTDGARRLCMRACELRERVLATAPRNREYRFGTAIALSNASAMCGDDESARLLARATQLLEALVEEDPSDEGATGLLSYVWIREGARRAQFGAQRGEDPAPAFERAEEIARGLAIKHPDSHRCVGSLGIAYSHHAQWLHDHDPDAAMRIFRRVQDVLRPEYVLHPEDYSMMRHLAFADGAEAEALLRSGMSDEAIALADRVVATLRDRLQKDPTDSMIRIDLAGALETSSRVRGRDGRAQAAEARALLLQDRTEESLSNGQRQLLTRLDKLLEATANPAPASSAEPN